MEMCWVEQGVLVQDTYYKNNSWPEWFWIFAKHVCKWF